MSLQPKLTGATSAYDLARTLLAQHGISTPDQAYAACPDMHPRTVRRIFAEGQIIDGLASPAPDTVLKEKGELLTNNPLPLTDSISPDDLNTLTEKAQAAGVKTFSAVTAVLRFGNPLERVVKVLDDLVTLAKTARPARSPSGLFVHAMRHGSDIKLPDPPETRQAEQRPQYPPLRVGEWVKWNLEWMRVLVLEGTQALLSPTDDPLDAYKAPADNLRHLPRRAALTG